MPTINNFHQCKLFMKEFKNIKLHKPLNTQYTYYQFINNNKCKIYTTLNKLTLKTIK